MVRYKSWAQKQVGLCLFSQNLEPVLVDINESLELESIEMVAASLQLACLSYSLWLLLC